MEHISKTITQQQTTSTPTKTKTTESHSKITGVIPATKQEPLSLPLAKGECPKGEGVKELQSKIFNFPEVLTFLSKLGKQTYGPDFKIYEEDHNIIFKLLTYFFQDEQNAEKYNINLRKGILLTGPIGCGKTSLMSLMRYIFPPERQHAMVTTRKIAFEYAEQGFKIIHKYSSQSFKNSGCELTPKTYCFDDLGVESEIKHYGNRCNIMAEILLSRYDLFTTHNMLTHLTTNLSAAEIEEYYGNRVRSRMREMFNLIPFTSSLRDKRNQSTGK